MNNKLRYGIVMVIGVLMNQFLYLLVSDNALDLPVWLDLAGTALAALMLEPAAGLLVGFVNNFLLAVEMMDSSSIIYFAVSAAVAVICGAYLVKDGRICKKRILPGLGLLLFSTAILGTVLTLWRTGGVPDSKWEVLYYEMAQGFGWNNVFSCFFATGLVKLFDLVASTGIIALCYLVFPKKLKYSKEALGTS